MQKIDYNIYTKMEELKKFLNEKQLMKKIPSEIEDIKFAGTIDWTEINPKDGTKIPSKKDIYICKEKDASGNIILKYFDENQKCIAINSGNGIISTKESISYALNNNSDFLSELNNLDINNELSLNDVNNQLNRISEELNISKEQILSIAQVNYDFIKKNKDENSDKIKLKKDENTPHNVQEKSQNNNTKKKRPNIKQETNLNQRINNKYTLGDILGVPEGGKLVTVYSSDVENNTSSTKFTFLIEDKDGNFMPCENLQLIGGNLPTNNVYSSNYDGTSVKMEQVNSMYRVKSPYSNENYVITADIGSMGTIDLGIGQAPRLQGMSSSKTALVTAPLKTSSTYNTQTETKETLLSYHSGIYAADERSSEAKNHNDDCEITMYEVDGDITTGHQHSTYDVDEIDKNIDNMLIELYNEKGDDYFSYDSFKSDFIKTYLNGNTTPDDEELASACKRCENEHSRTQDRNR